MTNLTHFEAVVLNEIAHHEMNSSNGARPTRASDVNTWCWADDFTGGEMTVPQVKGVLSSLVKKNLIHCEGKGREASCGFTEAGFAAFEEAFPMTTHQKDHGDTDKSQRASVARKNTTKYDYPTGLTNAQKKAFRAKARRAK